MQDAQLALQDALPALVHEAPALDQAEQTLPEVEPALPFRSDTMLGVCHALGEDFGFNPNYLRVALGSLVLWNPWGAFGIYLALGAAVALSRWLVPAQRPVAAPRLFAHHGSAANADNMDAGRLSIAA